MAFAHHDATRSDKRSCGKADFISTKQSRNQHITARTNAAIGLHGDTATQIVCNQSLLRFSQTDFPWRASMLD